METFKTLLNYFDQFGNIVIFLFLISIGYFIGRRREKAHYKSIALREKYFAKIPAVTIKNALDEGREIEKVEFVTGSVVVSADYFKMFAAGLKNFFGGTLTTYETLMDRAKREAVLRMKEAGRHSDIILNLKIDTASISKSNETNKNTVFTVEAIASGTAVTYKKP